MIYLDRSATTPLCDAAKKAICDSLDIFGNPSSLYSIGLEAEHLISDARKNILFSLGVRQGKATELVFTGSGSEANNLALFGVAHAKDSNKGKKIIVSASEHPSVIESAKALANEGYNVAFIPCPNGVFDIQTFQNELTDDTILCSVMLINNETGAINDVKTIFDIARKTAPNCVCHTDCVQAFGKIAISPAKLSCDLISISSHKIGAPKGVGALYISPETLKTKRISPIIHGGEQENNLRAGTENTLGIAAFGAAAAQGVQNIENVKDVRTKLISSIGNKVTYNIPDGEYLPNILSVTLPGIKSETMLHFLSSNGIFVSAGSACSAHSQKPSHVLLDFGLDSKKASCTVRLSFDENLSNEEIKFTGECINRGIDNLARMR